jgi:hypothetical protein
MTSKAPGKKQPGRPRKVPTIPEETFSGILKEKPGIYNIEFKYSFGLNYKKYMNTFVSCGVEEIYLYFTPDSIKIKGQVNSNNTSVDITKSTDEKYTILKLLIAPKNILAYYCDTSYILKVKITDIAGPLEDVDESCVYLAFKHIAGKTDIDFEVANGTIGAVLRHQIPVELVHQDSFNDVDNVIDYSVKNANVMLENVKASNLKKILSRPNRKKNSNSNVEVRNDFIYLHFLTDDRSSDIEFPMLTPDAYKSKIESGKKLNEEVQAIAQSKSSFQCNLPFTEILKFLLHIKDMNCTFYFLKKNLVIKVRNKDSCFILCCSNDHS